MIKRFLARVAGRLRRKKRELDVQKMVNSVAVFFSKYPREFSEIVLRQNELPEDFWQRYLQDRLANPGPVGTTNVLVREAWLERTLSGISEGSKILDAGAGELQYKKFCGHLKYTSQDFAQYDGQGDSTGLQTGDWDNTKIDIVSDITNIPVSEGSFDAVMCVEVLEHVPNPIEALRELVRVLRPGGSMILTAPFASLTHFAPYHFATGFSRYFYDYWAKEFDLEVVELKPNGNHFEYLAQELRRLPSVAEKYSSKIENSRDKFFLAGVLDALNELSSQDRGSADLLCHGYHFLGTKHSKSR